MDSTRDAGGVGATTAETMSDHILSVAVANDIDVITKPHASARAEKHRVLDGNGKAVRGTRRRIVIKPVRGRVTYYVALHELGHHLGARPPRRLEQEVAAWRWALANANFPATRGVWKHIARCLESYEARANRWRSMRLPPAGHDYWQLLEQARSEGF